MGAVGVDIKKKEREFEPFTLSDENVVKYLIRFRSKVDPNYGATINTNIYEAGDTFEFNTELIALYASLDETIKKCRFEHKELMFLSLLMAGYTIRDVVKKFKLYSKRTAHRTYNRIVERILEVNHQEWKKCINNTILKD